MAENYDIFEIQDDIDTYGSRSSQIKGFLNRHHVPVHDWEKSSFGRLPRLIEDIQVGKNVLYAADDEVVCQTSLATVDVVHDDGDDLLKLFEIRRIYPRANRKYARIEHTIGKRMLAGEPPQAAALRAMRAALHMTPRELTAKRPTSKREPYTAFPGIIHNARIFGHVALIQEIDFRPTGYDAEHGGYHSVYRWSQISRSRPEPR